MKKLRDNLIDVLCLAVVVGIVVFVFIFFRPEGAIRSVQVNGKKVPLKHVQVLKIPPETYKSIKDNPSTWSLYLTGHKKRVLVVFEGNFICMATPQGKCWGKIESIFGKYPKVRKSYKKHIESISKYDDERGPKCNGKFADDCPMKWLKRVCRPYCIINPNTQEVIIDYSENVEQILPILMGFADWNKEPLLNPKK